MKSDFNSIIKEIEKSQKRIRSLTSDLIKKAEKMLKGPVLYSSTQEYNDNDYYSQISIESVDGVHFDCFYVLHEIDVSELETEIDRRKNDPRSKVKEMLHIKDDSVSEHDFDKVVEYCLSKGISAQVFMEAFDALDSVKGLELPEDKLIYK